jgi:hypothetical protein
LNRVKLPLGSKPYAFMISTEIEPRFVEHYRVMPSAFLRLKDLQ